VAPWFTRAGRVQTVIRDEREEHVGDSYEVSKHALDVGDGVLYNLGDVVAVTHSSL
jgi:hypothetical protein